MNQVSIYRQKMMNFGEKKLIYYEIIDLK